MAVRYRSTTLPNPTTLSSDYNLYLAGSATAIRYFNGSNSTDYTLAGWQAASGQDANSLAPTAVGQVNFVNPTGNSTAVNLHVQSPTAIEGKGTDVGVTDDYDGETRSSFTPTDIGADAGNFVPYDVTPPVINLSSASKPDLIDPTLSNVIITDNAAGVNIAAGTRPRVYYKRSTDANVFNDNTCNTVGWKYVEATGAGGSPFSFTLDYSLLSGAPAWTRARWFSIFVVAQDKALPPNVGIAPATFTSPPPPALRCRPEPLSD